MNIIPIIFGLVMVPAEMPPLWLMVVIGIVFIFSMVLIGVNVRQENTPVKRKS